MSQTPSILHHQGRTGLQPVAPGPLGLVDGQFKEMLGRIAPQEESKVRFSSHAQERLDRRGIEMGASQMRALESGFSALKNKGVRDGLVVVGDNRFVVSVENSTVITVLSSKDREVFTNIQGVAFE